MWNKSDLWEEAHGKCIYLFLIPVSCIWDWCHLRLDWLIELLLVIKHSDGKIHQSCFWRNEVWGTFLAASLRQRMPCDPLLYNSSSSSLLQVIKYTTICLTNYNISTYFRLALPVAPNINSFVIHVGQFKQQTMRLLENDMTPVARFHLIWKCFCIVFEQFQTIVKLNGNEFIWSWDERQDRELQSLSFQESLTKCKSALASKYWHTKKTFW